MNETIKRLKELMGKATSRPWESLETYNPETHDEGGLYIAPRYTSATLNDEALILESINSLPELLAYIEELEGKVYFPITATEMAILQGDEERKKYLTNLQKKAEAGERLADAVRDMDGDIDDWKPQRDAALSAYEQAIK